MLLLDPERERERDIIQCSKIYRHSKIESTALIHLQQKHEHIIQKLAGAAVFDKVFQGVITMQFGLPQLYDARGCESRIVSVRFRGGKGSCL